MKLNYPKSFHLNFLNIIILKKNFNFFKTLIFSLPFLFLLYTLIKFHFSLQFSLFYPMKISPTHEKYTRE